MNNYKKKAEFPTNKKNASTVVSKNFSNYSKPKSYVQKNCCILFNDSWMPKVKYSLYTSNNCFSLKNSIETTEDLGVGLDKKDTRVKHFCKYENNLHKEMKYIYNQDRGIFKMAKEASTFKDIQNINALNYE